MAASELNFQLIYDYLLENGGKVRNRDAVRYFKIFLTDPVNKDDNRRKFKEYVNHLALTRQEGDDKVLILKTKYHTNQELVSSSINKSTSSSNLTPSPYDPHNSVGLPPSSIYGSSPSLVTPPRQPPPYRNPPPVVSPSSSLDSISLSSNSTLEERPSAPPRRKTQMEDRSISRSSLSEGDADGNGGLSVKERTQQFNRMASVDEDSSPRILSKSAEKDKNKNWVSAMDDVTDVATLTLLEPKKCQEWYVTASRADCQELLKLAQKEPRLVNKKANVLHWGAKYGNAEIIKIFAGKYKVDVNSRTNGGYTPLHIAAQFGHKETFKLLIEVYKADPKIRDYSGRTADYYLLSKKQKENSTVTLRKIKGRKKQSDKDLGFLRIGSLNVRVKKTTEAFSNFLGVGGGGNVTPTDHLSEKVHKGWGSADNVNKEIMGAPKGYMSKRKSKRALDSGLNSTPSTPKTPVKNYSSSSLPLNSQMNDSDSDSAAGFDSNWKK
ncbi:hypothetical protein ABEB36_000829 [Hypothenemus hampei]|uniref:SOWAHA-C winged helix-turn-helix domain-containing protein n=1 Tax=Hypothenemus hampei TaxID=57062 RepID=A0ABD1FCJ7_HYPHA